MGQIRGYRELVVWQKSLDLAVLIFRLCRELPREELYVLSSQLRRAALAVPSDVAEGNRRGTRKDYAHFVGMARGSVAEVETALEVARRLEYLRPDRVRLAIGRADEVSRMLNRLHSKLRASQPPPPSSLLPPP